MSARNIIELVILAAIWGASFLFMRIAVPEFGAVVLIEARVAIAALVLLPFWWHRESASSRQQVVKHWPRIFVVGLLNSSIPFVLFAYSMLYITGGVAAILNGTAPIWGLSLMSSPCQQKVRLWQYSQPLLPEFSTGLPRTIRQRN